MARIEKTIFISYRRKDISWALAVYQYLTSQKYDVFFDYTSIPSGDFEQIIVSNIKARAHFVLILTPTALDRCSQPGDWLRREIEIAIDEKRNIIPLLFDGFNFGSTNVREKLTGKLEAIPRYNALEIPSGYFIEAMERLSGRYLNVPLDAVIHPVSTEVRKVVREEQNAVNNAIVQKWEDIKELIKPTDEKSIEQGQARTILATDSASTPKTWTERLSQRNKLGLYGIGAGILLFLVLVIASLNALRNNSAGKNIGIPTRTSQAATQAINVEPAVSPLITNTDAAETPIPTNTILAETQTPIITPTPTLGIGSTMISPRDGMVLVYVPEGKFIMGLDGDEDDNPAHEVNLDAFWIDQTEVTNATYAICVNVGNCNPPSDIDHFNNPGYANHPVAYVSWNDASAYCSWALRRLPTEAEWEKAARGTDARIYPWGNKAPSSALLNYNQEIGETTEVRNYPDGISPYGAYDMAGNVWEWVGGWYDVYPSGNAIESPDFGEYYRVMRGGSLSRPGDSARSINRFYNGPNNAVVNVGFRCAQDVIP